MLILPIVNRGRLLNAEVKLKTAGKIRTGIRFADASESEVIVNGRRLSESIYKDDRNDRAALDFIRNNSLLYRRNFLVTTREESHSTLYDVYEVEQPPKKVTEGLDNLYTSVLTDMRKELPDNKRGRYVSLAKLGVGDCFTDENIERIQGIVSTVRDTSQWPSLFEKAGVSELIDTLEFLKQFDCTVVEDTSVKEETLQVMVESLKKLNTRDSRNLSNYYDMALSNRDVYAKISQVNRIVYDRPLTLIQSKHQKQKQLVKVNTGGGESNGGQAA